MLWGLPAAFVSVPAQGQAPEHSSPTFSHPSVHRAFPDVPCPVTNQEGMGYTI